MNTSTLQSLQRRFDREALDQLRIDAARLAAENDVLREQLARVEEAATSWRDDALELQLQLCKELRAKPAITVTGRLAVVA
ncbi:MAG: hypothetical protein ACTS5I_10010 [Rhodanobacter sp.]